MPDPCELKAIWGIWKKVVLEKVKMVISFLYKIFKLVCLTYKISESIIRSLLKSFKPIIYCARGITLIETVVIATLLAGAAFGVTYFFAQTKTTMSSSSQLMECQTIAKQALAKVVSLGSRLYGYGIKHNGSKLKYYEPLLIGDENGHNLKTPSFYEKLFEELGLNPPLGSPTKNSGVPIINSSFPKSKIEIGTSVMLVNSVNALQYLYNSDPAGYSGGKTMNIPAGGMVSEMLKKYKKRFDLKDVQFGIKIYPMNLQTGKSIDTTSVECRSMFYDGTKYDTDTSTNCPNNKVLTRPRFGKAPAGSEIPKDYLKIIGNPDIGFEVRVTFEYKRNEQVFSCDAMQKFNHSIKPIIKRSPLPNLEVEVISLRTGAGRNLITDPLKTSCDTDGGGYDDIIVELDFSKVQGRQIGTVLLCRMNSYCRSFGDDGGRNGCSPVEDAPWQRCHDIQPKQGSDQSWTPKSTYDKQKAILTLTFENMKPNRRYDLHVGEFSMAGNLISINHLFSTDPANPDENFVFYLDNTRPTIGVRRIKWDAVGLPSDGKNGRKVDPRASISDWKPPQNSDPAKWLQCEKDDNVHFQAQVKDQFTHNITGCPSASKKGIIGTRRDGSGGHKVPISGCILPREIRTNRETGKSYCWSPADSGSLSGPQCNGAVRKGNIKHGRHTIAFTPSDTCGQARPSWKLVWDTDLPDTFDKTKGFKDSEYWFKKSEGPAYLIKTEIPAKNNIGKFPKHYTVDCAENYIGSKPRADGDSGQLECILETANTYNDDGCNPSTAGVQYYHVCGGVGQYNKQTKWAVYASENKFCLNVPCDPDELLCCQDPAYCGSSIHKCLKKIDNPTCSSPRNGAQDNGSGCPNLGLYDCNYTVTCGTGFCSGSERVGDGCTYTVTDYNDCDENGVCATTTESGTCSNGGGGCREKSQPNNPQNEKCLERNCI